jgi:hypothetical protein
MAAPPPPAPSLHSLQALTLSSSLAPGGEAVKGGQNRGGASVGGGAIRGSGGRRRDLAQKKQRREEVPDDGVEDEQRAYGARRGGRGGRWEEALQVLVPCLRPRIAPSPPLLPSARGAFSRGEGDCGGELEEGG